MTIETAPTQNPFSFITPPWAIDDRHSFPVRKIVTEKYYSRPVKKIITTEIAWEYKEGLDYDLPSKSIAFFPDPNQRAIMVLKQIVIEAGPTTHQLEVIVQQGNEYYLVTYDNLGNQQSQTVLDHMPTEDIGLLFEKDKIPKSVNMKDVIRYVSLWAQKPVIRPPILKMLKGQMTQNLKDGPITDIPDLTRRIWGSAAQDKQWIVE